MAALPKPRPAAAPPTLEQALSATPPPGLAAAVAAVQAAVKRFVEARNMQSESASRDTLDAMDKAAREAREAWQQAVVLAELAGDDAPTEEDIAALKATADRAAERRENHELRARTISDEVERRRVAMEEANAELGKILEQWREPFLVAADVELAAAIRTINSLNLTLRTLEKWRPFRPELSQASFVTSEPVKGGEAIALPAPIAQALSVWNSAYDTR